MVVSAWGARARTSLVIPKRSPHASAALDPRVPLGLFGPLRLRARVQSLPSFSRVFEGARRGRDPDRRHLRAHGRDGDRRAADARQGDGHAGAARGGARGRRDQPLGVRALSHGAFARAVGVSGARPSRCVRGDALYVALCAGFGHRAGRAAHRGDRALRRLGHAPHLVRRALGGRDFAARELSGALRGLHRLRAHGLRALDPAP